MAEMLIGLWQTAAVDATSKQERRFVSLRAFSRRSSHMAREKEKKAAVFHSVAFPYNSTIDRPVDDPLAWNALRSL